MEKNYKELLYEDSIFLREITNFDSISDFLCLIPYDLELIFSFYDFEITEFSNSQLLPMLSPFNYLNCPRILNIISEEIIRRKLDYHNLCEDLIGIIESNIKVNKVLKTSKSIFHLQKNLYEYDDQCSTLKSVTYNVEDFGYFGETLIVLFKCGKARIIENYTVNNIFNDIFCDVGYKNVYSNFDSFILHKKDRTIESFKDKKKIFEGIRFSQISCGDYHFCAILEDDGSLMCWGSNFYSQLENTPQDSGYVSVSCGGYHTVALNVDGIVRVWGDNRYSQCNLNFLNENIRVVSCGVYHSAALNKDGQIMVWGDARFNQSMKIPKDANYYSIECGDFHTIARKKNGETRIWGDGFSREIHCKCAIPSKNICLIVDENINVITF